MAGAELPFVGIPRGGTATRAVDIVAREIGHTTWDVSQLALDIRKVMAKATSWPSDHVLGLIDEQTGRLQEAFRKISALDAKAGGKPRTLALELITVWFHTVRSYHAALATTDAAAAQSANHALKQHVTALNAAASALSAEFKRAGIKA